MKITEYRGRTSGEAATVTVPMVPAGEVQLKWPVLGMLLARTCRGGGNSRNGMVGVKEISTVPVKSVLVEVISALGPAGVATTFVIWGMSTTRTRSLSRSAMNR